jgi:ABC-type multidrug transport system fused ATPase/permease subunit
MKIKFSNILKTSLLLFFAGAIYELMKLLFNEPFLSSLPVKIMLLIVVQLALPVYLINHYLTKENKNFKTLFVNYFFVMYSATILIVLFQLFIHNFVDTDYKNRITENTINKLIEHQENVEKEKHLKIINKNYEEHREKLLKEYQPVIVFKNLLISLPVHIVLSLIIAGIWSVVLVERSEKKGKKAD